MIKLGIIGHPLSIISHLQDSEYMKEIIWTGFYPEIINVPGLSCSLIPGFTNADLLIAASDAIVISDNSNDFYNMAVMALKHAKHLFMPVTMLQSVAEANKLIKLANEANVLLKVYKSGIFPIDFHKRFAFNGDIWLIELQHFARGSQGNTGKDLFTNLLHNLDFVLSLTHSNVAGMKATGLNMVGSGIDIINTRIDFDNGCTSTITCNSASLKDEHTGTIVLRDKIMRLDFIREDAVVWNITRPDQVNDSINTDRIDFQHGNNLSEDLCSFIALLKEENPLLLNSEDSLRPFILASKIMDKATKTIARPV
jgi:hypothetical protein